MEHEVEDDGGDEFITALTDPDINTYVNGLNEAGLPDYVLVRVALYLHRKGWDWLEEVPDGLLPVLQSRCEDAYCFNPEHQEVQWWTTTGERSG